MKSSKIMAHSSLSLRKVSSEQQPVTGSESLLFPDSNFKGV